ncbi:MAG: NAD-dependent epimerase/dehydratase family protein [Deltaproteobacteria bacterium]|nr:NAD-dependent epimerase/dehydratase family protein [Deltaproteobacteria bacterium]
MSERVLVTGGAGFIGSHLADALLTRGDEVRVLDDLVPEAHPERKARFVPPGADLVVGDLRDPAAVNRALEGVEVVHHLGGIVGNGKSMLEVRRTVDVNVVGTATLLEGIVARRDRIRRLVVASSMAAYGDGAYRCAEHGAVARVRRTDERLASGLWEPLCPRCEREVEPIATSEDHPLCPISVYGVSKRDQEELCLSVARAHAIPTIALRYLNTYGSRQTLGNPYTGVAALMATRLLSGRRPTIFEDGKQRRDLVHVSDVVRATIAAGAAPERAWYQAFNVGTGRSVTVVELAKLISRALGRDLEPEMTGEHRAGDIRHCFADVTRARELLGFAARVSLSDGASELVDWAAGERALDSSERANAELRARGIIR